MNPRVRLIAVLLGHDRDPQGRASAKWPSGFRKRSCPDKLYDFWQCAQMPAISTTDNFGAKPEARAAALRLCATGAAGISPTDPQASQIRNATIAAASWSWAQAR